MLWPIIQTGWKASTPGRPAAELGLPADKPAHLLLAGTVSDWNWILGVGRRPGSPPRARRGDDWIESGYTWLLWGGGIPLLVSYFAFAGAVLRRGWAFARRADPAGVAATAVAAAMCSQVVLMTFDPHLTYRGSGDELFLLLALIRVLPVRRTRAAPVVPADVDTPTPRSEGLAVLPL